MARQHLTHPREQFPDQPAPTNSQLFFPLSAAFTPRVTYSRRVICYRDQTGDDAVNNVVRGAS